MAFSVVDLAIDQQLRHLLNGDARLCQCIVAGQARRASILVLCSRSDTQGIRHCTLALRINHLNLD